MHHGPRSVGSVPQGNCGLVFNRLRLFRKIETNAYRHPTARLQCTIYHPMENSFNNLHLQFRAPQPFDAAGLLTDAWVLFMLNSSVRKFPSRWCHFLLNR